MLSALHMYVPMMWSFTMSGQKIVGETSGTNLSDKVHCSRNDFDFLWLLTINSSIFMHHNDFNIGEAMNLMGMARQRLAQHITIQLPDRR
jgi:hypothetical protein